MLNPIVLIVFEKEVFFVKMETTATSNDAPTPVSPPSQTVETAVNACTTQTAPKLMVEMDGSSEDLERLLLKGIPLLRLQMNNLSALDVLSTNVVHDFLLCNLHISRFRMWDMPARLMRFAASEFYADKDKTYDLKINDIPTPGHSVKFAAQ
ncbi:hypothetical protein MKW98_000228, partial [Papaver atlanticum]